MESSDYVRLFYAIFQIEIDKCYADGNRVIVIEFASTKRLTEWIEKGDSSCKVKLYNTPTEKGILHIQNTYPRTAKTIRENESTVAIVIASSLIIITTQSFGVTAFLKDRVNFNGLRETYPKHFELKLKR